MAHANQTGQTSMPNDRLVFSEKCPTPTGLLTKGSLLQLPRDGISISSMRFIDSSSRLQHSLNGEDHPRPTFCFGLQLLTTRSRQLVVLCAAIVLGLAPLGINPPFLLHAVKRRVERAFFYGQHVFREFVNPLGNCPAMHPLTREGFEDEQVQRSLE